MTPTERMASRPFGLIASLILHVAPQRSERVQHQLRLKRRTSRTTASSVKRTGIVSQAAKRSQSQSRLGEVRLRVVIKQFHELLGKDTKLSDIWSQQTHLVEDRR
jgi:hypothetical protein